jgi:hypothetical protein
MPFKSAAIIIAMTMAVPAFAQTADAIRLDRRSPCSGWGS